MLLAACVATGVAQAGDDWPEFPVPDELEVNWQSDNMVVNGMPMHIVEFRCDCPAEHVLEYYRRRWRDAKPVGYVEQPMGDRIHPPGELSGSLPTRLSSLTHREGRHRDLQALQQPAPGAH